MRTRTRILGIATVLAVAVPLAACTGGTEDPLPSVTVESLTVPDSMLPTEAVIDRGGEFLAASGDLPLAFGGSVTEPGKTSVPAVWISDDATTWQRTIVDSDFDGSFDGALAGSSERAALGGLVWKDRAYSSVLWASEDRTTWEPIALPDAFLSTFRLSVLSVVGARIFGIGVSTEGEAAGFVVSGDSAAEISLPELGDVELLSPASLTGEGSNLLLVARPGPEGEPAATVSFVSADRGKSWSDPVEIADSTAGVAGVAWTGTEYVATGWSPRTTAGGASDRASSWVSVDGSSWSKEAVPAPPDDGPFFLVDVADEWFGAPSTAGGVVTVVAANANAAISALFTRSASGAWSFTGTTSANEASGGSGMAVPLGDAAGTAIDGDTTAAVLLGSDGYLRAGTFAGSSYRGGATLAGRQFLALVNDAFPGPEGIDLVLRKRVFTVTESLGWRNTSEYSLAGYTGGDAVSTSPWNPEILGSLLNVTMAADAGGGRIITGSAFPEGRSVILAQGFYRADDDADWIPMTGFSAEGSTELFALASTGKGWVAVGDYRTSSNAGTPSHATAWQSTDGVAWSRAAGDFGDGLLESSLTDVCILPDGTPIGIGWTEVNTGSYRMTVWSPDGDSWAKRDLGEFGEREGFGSSCANDDAGVVASATIGGRDVLLRTTTGADWRQVFKAERGVNLYDPVAVPGGFAAAGSWANDTTAGAVVWLSRDGIRWTPVSIPSRNPDSTNLVAAYGGDLLVALPAISGDPLLVVRDIEKVIDELVPKAEK
ncbi:MAG TPA: hypothetical protein VFS93_00985 [Terrimesophilobacter sp.]|nr:hypothetical protein [Terrimesophilobacter sp.]